MTHPTHAYRFPLRLFQATGVELEYMIVSDETLDVRPISDEVIRAVMGAYRSDAEPDGPDGPITWSNELVLHVIELKTTHPAPGLEPLAELFQENVGRINRILRPLGARLMPGAMHPWMDPLREMRLWPHDYGTVYRALDRVFSCTGHGWANLQSVHVNLPFGDDAEFGRLHAAIRLILPLIPALAAASPVADGRPTGNLDQRMEVYRTNARRVPSVCGLVVPEAIYTRDEYENHLLAGIYRDIAPLDPEGILQHEWLNARGCIARFDRGSIEIRVIDVQECPAADLAVVALIVAAVRGLAEERWCSAAQQRAVAVEPLHAILLQTIRGAEGAALEDLDYLRLLGWRGGPCPAGAVWSHLARAVLGPEPDWPPALRIILERGTLATRLLRALGPQAPRPRLKRVYQALCDCLQAGRSFDGVGG
jgi:gamma-glutamyl:cysteine ligase YbdK (ATP-grasp superfamily)